MFTIWCLTKVLETIIFVIAIIGTILTAYVGSYLTSNAKVYCIVITAIGIYDTFLRLLKLIYDRYIYLNERYLLVATIVSSVQTASWAGLSIPLLLRLLLKHKFPTQVTVCIMVRVYSIRAL
jgi:hypothetical protein